VIYARGQRACRSPSPKRESHRGSKAVFFLLLLDREGRVSSGWAALAWSDGRRAGEAAPCYGGYAMDKRLRATGTKAQRASLEVRRKQADERARQVAPIVAELQASGARGLRAIARGLNERGIRTPRGSGAWKAGQVGQLLARLQVCNLNLDGDHTTKSRAAAVEAHRKQADARAAEVAPIIAGLWAAGVTSTGDIAKALNERGVRTLTGKGKWRAAQVRLALARLK
jgi:hypothetical protein